METLDGTQWDVVIAGMGLQESLLALSLSRSGLRILHLGNTSFYGGSEAALTLQEVENWASEESERRALFRDVVIEPVASNDSLKLLPSRSYTIALAPQVVHAKSSLVPKLVSSRIDKQLEFCAVSNWWTIQAPSGNQSPANGLLKVPNGREDLFEDQHLDQRGKRALMKFLRFIMAYEEQEATWLEHAEGPFSGFLQNTFGLRESLQPPIFALVMSMQTLIDIKVKDALPRIALHLRSMNALGRGFSAVVPKWGGLAEVAQIACRACAVGGGEYVLNCAAPSVSQTDKAVTVALPSGASLTTKWLITGPDSSIADLEVVRHSDAASVQVRHRTSILSSSLQTIVRNNVEGAPVSAGAVVAIPTTASDFGSSTGNMVFVIIHSSETGCCPNGQSIVYASVMEGDESDAQLDQALNQVIAAAGEPCDVLWSLRYTQTHGCDRGVSTDESESTNVSSKIIHFPPLSCDPVIVDGIFDRVRQAWQMVAGETGEFLKFSPRSGEDDEEELDGDVDETL